MARAHFCLEEPPDQLGASDRLILLVTGGVFFVGFVLPGWADELLDLIGVSWPNVDEDDYREMANAMREFADDIDEGANEAHTAIQGLVGSAGGSLAVEALNAHWGKVNGTHLKGLADCGRMAGTAMDGVAVLIEGAKIGALVQLGILAAEVIAAQAAAPFTLGLSEVGALAATQATRVIVKRLFKEVCQQVAEQVISIALTPVEEALGAMVGDLVVQLGANALGVQDGVDLSQTAKAGKVGFGQGVQDAKDSAKSAADNPMELLSAGGRRGGGGSGGLGGSGGSSGGGSAGGSGGFSFDKDEHDRVVTSLESAGGTFRNKAGGKIGRARSHHGRTRGKDAIADAANAMLDKVIEGIEDGVKKTAKHLDDNMTRGIKQMAKNHHDNDQKLSDHFKGLSKNGKNDPKGPTPTTAGGGKNGSGSAPNPHRKDPSSSNKAREQLGQDHANNNTRTQDSRRSNGTDPIDLASGRMYLPQTDVTLPGSLPLVFSRRVESGYRIGRWFGPSWSSTADQHLDIDGEGVIFVTEDGLLLSYPHPAEGVSVLPASGPRWPLSRDEVGDYTISAPAIGRTWHFTSHSDGRALLDEISDRNGQWISFDYNADGTPTAIRHGAGYHLKLTTADGRITALHLADAASDGSDQELFRYGYTDGNLTEVTNSSGRPLTFEYDERGRVIAWIDTNGSRYDYYYDGQDRCIAQGGTEGHMSLRLTYDQIDPGTDLRVTTTTDTLGHTSRFLINDTLQVVAEIDALGGSVRTEHDRYDRVLATTDEIGRATRFTYDEAGNLTTVIRPDGLVSTAAYNSLNLPTEITSPDGATWRQQYDERGNCTGVTDPSGSTTSYRYDSRGRVTAITDAVGHITRIESNQAGLPIAVTAPGGATTHYVRDAFGRIASVTDPLGSTIRLAWTVEGKLASRVNPDGTAESWTYDGEGNCLTHTNAIDGVTRYEYTHFDLPTARTGPDGVRHEFTHDERLQLVQVTNPQGFTWNYGYDAAGRLISESDFDGRILTYTHDAAGQLINRSNGVGESISFTRDTLGRVTEKATGDIRTVFAYDTVGRLLQATNADATLILQRDPLGRVLSETVNGRTIQFAHDALGRRTYRRTPMGAEAAWSYDAAGDRARLTTSGREIAIAYDAIGREAVRHLGENIALSHTWDVAGRLTSQSLASAADGPIQQRSYTYRADGNLIGIDDQLAGRRTFDLDVAGRVTAVHAHGWTERYAYDEAGNQTSGDWPAGHPGSEAIGPRAYTGTRITHAGKVRYEHDAQGRITMRQKTRLSRKPDTWRYEWDAEDRLTAVTTPDGSRWRYLYDPLGRRIAKQRLSASGGVLEQTTFSWDETTLAEQTTTTPGSPNAITLTWDHNGLHPIAQTERLTVANEPQQEIDRRFFAIITDLVGTPSELVDESGTIAWRTRTTMWGTTTWEAEATAYTPLRFPGQYFDLETELHYNFHRYYNPEAARYISPDPLGLEPAPNPVTYVDNPHTWADPLGLSACLIGAANSFPGVAHTLDEHVGISDERAIALAQSKPGGRNSVFIDHQTAQQVADYAVANNAARIQKWLRGSQQQLTFSGRFGANNPLGTTFHADGSQSATGNGYFIQLTRAKGHPGGFFISTLYPK
ncbi:RHS repeat-associated core domain-containing protein [Streptomyces decoyicus]|uniref:RHS repeat-associated core domain-containing protein n=1 Tax=Streptomyces decoyicus TaxID=249567 RepID=UPI00362FD7B2